MPCACSVDGRHDGACRRRRSGTRVGGRRWRPSRRSAAPIWSCRWPRHTRRDLLLWAALTHDWGKPAKRFADDEGRYAFYDHDHWGALLAEARLQALRFSGDEVDLRGAADRSAHAAGASGARLSAQPPGALSLLPGRRDDRARLRPAEPGRQPGDQAAAPDAEALRSPAGHDRACCWSLLRERPASRLIRHRCSTAIRSWPNLGCRRVRRIGELLEGLREAQAVGEVDTVDEALGLAAGTRSVIAAAVPAHFPVIRF